MRELTLHVDREDSQVAQFARALGVAPVAGRLALPAAFASGTITEHAFPGGVHLYLYDVTPRQPLLFRTVNPADSGMYVLSFSIGGSAIQKDVDGAAVAIGRDRSSGVLVYSPGVDSVGRPAVGARLVFAIVTLTQEALGAYAPPESPLAELVAPRHRFSLHHDLDADDDRALSDLVDLGSRATPPRMALHAQTLDLVGGVLARVARRDGTARTTPLHPDDVAALFSVREALRAATDGPPPPLAELAAGAGLSASKLTRAFRHLFGTSVYQYHLGARLDHARRLLASTALTIAEVSDRVGYSTPSHFSRAFRARFGTRPSEARSARQGRPVTGSG